MGPYTTKEYFNGTPFKGSTFCILPGSGLVSSVDFSILCDEAGNGRDAHSRMMNQLGVAPVQDLPQVDFDQGIRSGACCIAIAVHLPTGAGNCVAAITAFRHFILPELP